MISVVIPTLNAEAGLASTLAALVPAAVDGVVRQVIVVDGGSRDATRAIALDAGCDVVEAAAGRGSQLASGAEHARFGWLLFLHADTVLEPGWERSATEFMTRVDAGTRPFAAAAFRFSLDDHGIAPRIMEAGVAVRSGVFGLPYGDQALLIPARLYREVGGYKPLPLMEDVDLVRRLGWRRIVVLPARAVTSAARYRRDGYGLRIGRNLICLALFSVGAPVRWIEKIYG
jgi:rSAM/selenodomain-associated transferase 2